MVVWGTVIVAVIGLITGIYKYFIDPKRKARQKAVEDGKKAVDEGDVSQITASFGRLKK